jgi:hypothetical protein
MTEDFGMIELRSKTAPPPTWIEMANHEIAELQEAAKANPKEFFGNHVRGQGDGLTRVKALLPTVKKLEQALSELNRVL